MFDESDLQDLSESTEPSFLRSQALDLFDRCLTENNPALIIAFIERQVTQDPPPLHLLRAMDEDFLERLHSLRTHRFDIRGQVIKAFADSTRLDIAPMMPPGELDQYHRLQPESVMRSVLQNTTLQDGVPTGEDLLMLAKLLETSIETVGRLQSDIELAMGIHDLIADWLDALSSISGRRYWTDSASRDAVLH